MSADSLGALLVVIGAGILAAAGLFCWYVAMVRLHERETFARYHRRLRRRRARDTLREYRTPGGRLR